MSINMNDDEMIPENIPTDIDACYEIVASQEEIYLETTEETLRAILISEDPFGCVQETVCVDCFPPVDSRDDDLDRAAGELITGDSDDPPLSEEAVAEILRATSNARRFDG
jgi:hypothetical protein